MREDPDNIDLDEDLFGFETLPEGGQDAGDEEDLEAIFAAFQAQDGAGKAPVAQEIAAPARRAAVAEDDLVEEPASYEHAAADEGLERADATDDGTEAPRRPAKSSKPAVSGGQEHAAPKAQPQLVAAVGGLASKSTLLILVSVTTLNALVALVSLKYGADIRDSVVQAQREFANTTDRLQSDAREAAVELIESRTPLVPPDPEGHPTFERAVESISRGEYADARQRLYALLSVVDRLEESQRRIVEARAQFLIARATHLEAMERMEAER